MTSPKTPAFSLKINGQDITQRLGNLVSLSLTEFDGEQADTLSLTLADPKDELPLPKHGSRLELALGWVGDALIEKGEFTVAEVEYNGEPATLSVFALGANVVADLPGKKSRSWHRVSLASVVREIAAEHSLTPIISRSLLSINLPAPQQIEESDLHFLNRLAKPHDAIASVKNGNLIFMKKGEAVTQSGKPLPTVTVRRTQTTRHNYRHSQRDVFTGVQARWHSKAEGKYITEQVGTTERNTVLNGSWATSEEAIHAATAELQRLRRGQAAFGVTLATGNPSISPEAPLKAEGFKAEINAQQWRINRTTHRLEDNGLTTAVEADAL